MKSKQFSVLNSGGHKKNCLCKLHKRVIAVVSSIAMLFTTAAFFPDNTFNLIGEITASAAGDEQTGTNVASVAIDGDTTYYDNFNNAWNAAQDNTATVTLLSDVEVSETLDVGENGDITFDGGDYTLTSTVDGYEPSAFYVSDGNLTIKGGNIQMKDIDGATGVYVWRGEVTISGGNIKIDGEDTYGVYVMGGGTLNISGGVIQATGSGEVVGMWICAGTTVSITGGTFTGDKNAIFAEENKIRELLGMGYTFYNENDEPVDSSVLDSNELPGGTYTVGRVKECNHSGAEYTINNNGTHNINCPACGYEESEDCTPGDEYKSGNNSHWKECTVCNGKCNEEKHSFGEWAADNRTCEVCGYKQSAAVKVEIGEDAAFYGSIEEAWEAADGKTATITLLSDVTTDETLTVNNVNSNITFNGGIYTLTSTNNELAILVTDGKLNIMNGTIQLNDEYEYDSYRYIYRLGVRVDGGTVNISGGKIQATGDDDNAYGVYVDGGTVNISGGKIQATGGYNAYGVYVEEGEVSISGGDIQATGNRDFTYGVYVEGGKVSISGGDIQATGNNMGFGVHVEGGKVSISGGNIQGTSDGYMEYGVSVGGGTVNISGGDIQATGSLRGEGVHVFGGTANISGGDIRSLTAVVYEKGKVSITGGRLTGNKNAILCIEIIDDDMGDGFESENTKINELLGKGYAYYQDDNPVTSGLDSNELPGGTYTVKKCEHLGAVYTDNNNGTHDIDCPACRMEAVNCTYGEKYQHNENNHWLTCEICGYENVEKHSFTNYISNGDVTCIKDGTKTAKCDICDEKDTIAEKATGHSFTKYVSDGNATCTVDGTKTAKCDNCDETDTITDEKTAKGHSFTNYISNGDVTCTQDGTKTAKCDRCTVTDTIAEKATGHKLAHIDRNEPTSTDKGNIEYWQCEKCEKCFSDEAGEAEIELSDTEIPMVTTKSTTATTETTTTTTTTKATTKATTSTTKATTTTTKATDKATTATTSSTNKATTATTKATTTTTKATDKATTANTSSSSTTTTTSATATTNTSSSSTTTTTSATATANTSSGSTTTTTSATTANTSSSSTTTTTGTTANTNTSSSSTAIITGETTALTITTTTVPEAATSSTEATTVSSEAATTITTLTPEVTIITTNSMIESTTEIIISTTESTAITTGLTTESTTATTQYASVEDYCTWTVNDYYEKTGVKAANSNAVENKDGSVSIILTDETGSVLDTYVIDPVNGKGSNSAGEKVDLPQTGNNGLTPVVVSIASLGLTALGIAFVFTSRKRRED